MNSPELGLPSDNLVEVFERVITNGKVTVNERAIFLTAFFSPTTPQADLHLIDRLFWLTRLGKIKIAYDAKFPRINNLPHSPKPLKKTKSYNLIMKSLA